MRDEEEMMCDDEEEVAIQGSCVQVIAAVNILSILARFAALAYGLWRWLGAGHGFGWSLGITILLFGITSTVQGGVMAWAIWAMRPKP